MTCLVCRRRIKGAAVTHDGATLCRECARMPVQLLDAAIARRRADG